MPKWIYQRPVEECNEHETQVAKWLERLPNDYIVRWGFFYQDNKNAQREGDFLVLGPDGHLMILEVKKRVSTDHHSGALAGGAGMTPTEQLLCQNNSILNAFKEKARGKAPTQYAVPYVRTALAGCENFPHDVRPDGMEACQVLYAIRSFAHPETFWKSLFAAARPCKSPEAARRLFLDVFGGNVAGPDAKRFLSQTDQQILRQVAADYSLLDQLDENPVLLIRGGPGSGKSWLAVEAAVREAKAGKHTLFLCYNLDFKAEVAALLAKRFREPGPGRIAVRSWEELVNDLAAEAGMVISPPADGPGKKTYYSENLPQVMFEAITSGKITPTYDSLVVDEAQDHDTSSSVGISWWEVYRALLRSPETMRLRILFDPAQRPAFRDAAGCRFDVEELKGLFPQSASVRLTSTRRYTDALARYLRSLRSPATTELAENVFGGTDLPGPPPTISESQSFGEALKKVGQCIKDWVEAKGVDPRDILVLTHRRPFEGKNPPLDKSAKLGGCPLISVGGTQPTKPPYAIRATSFNKAKGLDAQAVVLVGTWPFESLSEGDQFAYFIAASRARQLLAVFAHRKTA